MPQTAEHLVDEKHNRLVANIDNAVYDRGFYEWFKECKRWQNELDMLNAPLIDRRPKK